MTFKEEFESVKAAAREWAKRDSDRQITLARTLASGLIDCELDYAEEAEANGMSLADYMRSRR